MNRLIYELKEIIKDDDKVNKVYTLLIDNNLLDLDNANKFNSRRVKVKECNGHKLINGCGITFCSECGWDDLYYG